MSTDEAPRRVGDEARGDLLDRLPDTVFETDADGRFVYLSAAWTTLSGYELAASQGESLLRYFCSDGARDVLRLVEGRLDDPTGPIAALTRADGQSLWVHLRATLSEGRLAGMMRDVSEVYRDHLERGELSEVARLTSKPVIILDDQARVTWANAAWQELTGYTLDEARGRTPVALLQGPDSEPPLLDAMIAALQSGRPHATTFLGYAKSGEAFWVLAEDSPVLDSQGCLHRIISVHSDVTLQHEHERRAERHLRELEDRVRQRSDELAGARATAEAEALSKDVYVSVVAKEVRAPLSAIIGYCHLLLASELDARQNNFVLKCDRAAKLLMSTVNDIVDSSRSQSAADLQNQTFSLQDVADDVVSLNGALARLKNLDFSFSLSPDVPPLVVGDRSRLTRVLVNLVNNAIKFTHRGAVKVDVETHSDATSDDVVELVFTVRDDGIGMSPEEVAGLYDAFTPEAARQWRESGGTGLGLATCKSLVTLMGGELTVDSTKGKGSSFRFTMSLRRPNQADRELHQIQRNKRQHHRQWNHARILVVDANVFNQQVAIDLLTDVGCEVEFADSGLMALEILDIRPRFDAMLLNAQLPDLDGLSVARRIRQDRSQSELVVIGLASSAGTHDADAYKAAGMNDVAWLPFTPEDLYALLENWLPSYRQRREVGGREVDVIDDIQREIDPSTLPRLLGDDPERISLVVTKFLQTSTRTIDLMRRASDDRDFDALRRLGHSLKSAAAAVGAIRMGRLCANLEELLQHGITSDVDQVVNDIASRYEKVRTAFGESDPSGASS